MATAHYFTKDGTKTAEVTDSSLTGWQCDYMGNGRVVMSQNGATLRLGNISPKSMVFDKSITIDGGAAQINRAVCCQRNVESAKDPSKHAGDFAYAVYRTS